MLLASISCVLSAAISLSSFSAFSSRIVILAFKPFSCAGTKNRDQTSTTVGQQLLPKQLHGLPLSPGLAFVNLTFHKLVAQLGVVPGRISAGSRACSHPPAVALPFSPSAFDSAVHKQASPLFGDPAHQSAAPHGFVETSAHVPLGQNSLYSGLSLSLQRWFRLHHHCDLVLAELFLQGNYLLSPSSPGRFLFQKVT